MVLGPCGHLSVVGWAPLAVHGCLSNMVVDPHGQSSEVMVGHHQCLLMVVLGARGFWWALISIGRWWCWVPVDVCRWSSPFLNHGGGLRGQLLVVVAGGLWLWVVIAIHWSCDESGHSLPPVNYGAGTAWPLVNGGGGALWVLVNHGSWSSWPITKGCGGPSSLAVSGSAGCLWTFVGNCCSGGSCSQSSMVMVGGSWLWVIIAIHWSWCWNLVAIHQWWELFTLLHLFLPDSYWSPGFLPDWTRTWTNFMLADHHTNFVSQS